MNGHGNSRRRRTPSYCSTIVIILLLIIIGIHIIHVISQQVNVGVGSLRHAEANKLGPLANKLGLEALSLCQPVQTLELFIPSVQVICDFGIVHFT